MGLNIEIFSSIAAELNKINVNKIILKTSHVADKDILYQTVNLIELLETYKNKTE